MQGHRRRRRTQRSPTTPSARRVAAGRHRLLCPSSSAMRTDISSSSLRELDAVALATNVTVFMKRGTKSEAEEAIQNLDGTEVEGQTIQVHVAQPRLIYGRKTG